jgi:hypothetical protein
MNVKNSKDSISFLDFMHKLSLSFLKELQILHIRMIT